MIVPNGKEFNYLFIVMDYVESDLKKVIYSTNRVNFTETHCLTIIYNALCALNFLHTANIMHRDIKPSNILIDSNCQIKLCDFGLSRPQVNFNKETDDYGPIDFIIKSPNKKRKI